MNPIRKIVRWSSVWAALSVAHPWCRADDAALSDAATDRTGTLALRGVVGIAQQWRLGIRDEANHQSVWLAVGESYRDCVIRSYDPVEEYAVIERRGSRLKLALNSGHVTTLAPDSSPNPDIAAESRRFGIDRSGARTAR